MPTVNLFNALNGTEVKHLILKEVERQIDLSGEFTNNITFPYLEWEVTAKVLAYPKQRPGEEPAIKVEAGGTITKHQDPDKEGDYGMDEITLGINEKGLKTVLEFDTKHTVDTPDLARVNADLPLPTPSPVPGVGIVDKLVQSVKTKIPTKSATPSSSPPEPAMAKGLPGHLTQSAHDVPTASGKFARQVTLGTRAADPKVDSHVVNPHDLSINAHAPSGADLRARQESQESQESSASQEK